MSRESCVEFSDVEGALVGSSLTVVSIWMYAQGAPWVFLVSACVSVLLVLLCIASPVVRYMTLRIQRETEEVWAEVVELESRRERGVGE